MSARSTSRAAQRVTASVLNALHSGEALRGSSRTLLSLREQEGPLPGTVGVPTEGERAWSSEHRAGAWSRAQPPNHTSGFSSSDLCPAPVQPPASQSSPFGFSEGGAVLLREEGQSQSLGPSTVPSGLEATQGST